jgi:hypothetical protein
MQVIAIHDVDDVDHWFSSKARAEFFEARGMKATAFRDPEGGSRTVAVLIEAPDMESSAPRWPRPRREPPRSTTASAWTP